MSDFGWTAASGFGVFGGCYQDQLLMHSCLDVAVCTCLSVFSKKIMEQKPCLPEPRPKNNRPNVEWNIYISLFL